MTGSSITTTTAAQMREKMELLGMVMSLGAAQKGSETHRQVTPLGLAVDITPSPFLIPCLITPTKEIIHDLSCIIYSAY